ncbi:nucleotidyltransferase AbiEii toxin of type IV toxin-antitoxin system [Spirosoma oryzae]|uniref:Nucleotidyltransferase AbiEii toxin of type IV toxin-antitoxin system n=1 Tax=Spirosoma oryzae TaxID=1469603 RepID=A0A2T0RKK9_9BACT|nr:nucleotidyltransferase AbiEii toxin of type IV toxin-antitoxin system [Spirosoma oryzae]
MLHYNTVNKLLRKSLSTLMSAEVFAPFRLVGGTALSLQLGHRISIDIDLFTDALYGDIDFE